MKYSDGRLYRRKVGQSRKDVSIYKHLGHPYDIKGKPVEFIGPSEHYSLTKGNQYTILDTNSGKFCFDQELADKCHKKDDKNYDASQGEDYFITVINDKGHKRKYSHLMFKQIKGVTYGKI